jgi:PKD repeat protein
VPLGDLVTFTLTPASVVMNSRYKVTLYFGDGAHQVMRQTELDHLYRKPGDYTYSILVEPSGSPTPTPTPTPAIPGVKLSATPTSVEINRPVDFAAQLSHSYPNIKYRFGFADGSKTDWRDSPQTTHSYRSPGSYQAYVDIGLGNSGSVKQVGGSPRQAIEVTAPPPRTIAVDLTADRVAVQAKDEVSFFARVDSTEPNVRYLFDFGDGSGSAGWQASPQTKHVYSSAGAYSARVDVRVMNSRFGSLTASSKPLPIKVESAPLPGVDLSVTPQSVPAGLPVYFKATADSANSKTRYRFNFGDGSPPSAWKATPEATHIYSLAGDYPAFVEIGSASNGPIGAMAASGKKRVQVFPFIPAPPATPTPSPLPSASPSPTGSESPSPDGSGSPLNGGVTSSPSPTSSPTGTPTPNPTPNGGGSSNNWWKYLLAALILFGGYQGWKYFYAPRPTLAPNLDPGVSALDAEGGPLSINFQMELDPNVTDGQFNVDTTEGSFIKSERKGDG